MPADKLEIGDIVRVSKTEEIFYKEGDEGIVIKFSKPHAQVDFRLNPLKRVHGKGIWWVPNKHLEFVE